MHALAARKAKANVVGVIGLVENMVSGDAYRPGDVLTHCFRPFPNTPVSAQGAIKPAVLAARERGVIFDIGHGFGGTGDKDPLWR